ncbi:PadR family transcriptional regulator [candidate division KSB1 bacterium]
MKELTKAEELILITIWRLRDNAYGVTIKEKIAETTGKEYAYGTLYALLDQLAHKEYIARRTGDPTPERGGRSKTFYGLTLLGIRALKAAVELHRAVWSGTDELLMSRDA